MTSHRTDLRAAVRAALVGSPRLAGATIVDGWSQALDTDPLPVIGLRIPREAARRAAYDEVERTVEVEIVIKRAGGETIEDEADLDTEAIETAVLAALRPLTTNAEVERTTLMVNGDGGRRVSTLTLTIPCLLYTTPLA